MECPTAWPDQCSAPGPAMTRCECAGTSFDEVVALVREGLAFDDVVRATGCGDTCTACVPDLRRHVAARARRDPRSPA